MTPLAGFIIAVLAGLLVFPPRRAMAASILPWLAILAVQSWHLATGHGVNPASTIRDPAYWVVQLISLALMLGVAAGMSAWRSRQVSDPRGSAMTPARVGALSATATVAALAVSLPIVILGPSGHGTGTGGPPLAGIAGFIACLVAIAVLGIAELRARHDRNSERGANLAPGDAR